MSDLLQSITDRLKDGAHNYEQRRCPKKQLGNYFDCLYPDEGTVADKAEAGTATGSNLQGITKTYSNLIHDN